MGCESINIKQLCIYLIEAAVERGRLGSDLSGKSKIIVENKLLLALINRY